MKPSARLRRLHFVGIGGAGMSALAEVFARWGFSISGSDKESGESLAHLKGLGLRVEAGHRAENLGEADAVVFSAAVPADNPELAEARRRGLPVVRRAELLGEAMRGKYALAVAGTHGKTTTTTMLGRIWLEAGRDPTILAGGTTRGDNFSAVAGKGEILIAEADEFDRAFLATRPSVALIGNIDSDHLDTYGSMEAVREAFLAFADRLPFYGQVVANGDDEGVRSILARFARRTVTYGLAPESDYRALEARAEAGGMVFAVEKRGTRLGEIRLGIPGLHNVYNALGAAAVSLEEGLSFAQVAQGLGQYQGVKRRLEFKGEKRGVVFYDDYAHHPTEVAAALQAARSLAAGRLVAVFQPHLYSRTRQLHREFAAAFQACDVLFVTRIYPAREQPIAGVEGNLISEAAAGLGLDPRNIHYVADTGTLARAVAPRLQPGDLVVTMGAGDIGAFGPRIMEALA